MRENGCSGGGGGWGCVCVCVFVAVVNAIKMNISTQKSEASQGANTMKECFP